MASSKEFLDCILGKLSGLDDVSCRPMMGEYIIYYRGRMAMEICDDRLLVKPFDSAKGYLGETVYEAPYPGAKEMLRVREVDDAEFLCGLLETIYADLPDSKPKKR